MLAEEASRQAFLRDGDLVLRPLSPADADGAYVQWLNDAEVCRWNSHHVRPYTREMALEYIASLSGGSDLVLAITVDGTHVGNVSLQKVSTLHRSADFATIIGDRSVWGTGVATTAGQLIVDHGFSALNLHRITSGTFADNVGARRLIEKLGMTHEGTRRAALFKHARYHDVFEYGLLVDEWRGQRA